MPTPNQDTQSLFDKILSLPPDRIAEVEDFVDFLKTRTRARQPTATEKGVSDFPVISVGKWPQDLSLRREDIYSDDGR